MRAKRYAFLAASLSVLALGSWSSLAPAAVTYQGSIATPVVSPSGESVSAQISVTALCDPIEYCGFFPEVTTVPIAQPCAPTITGSSWVGPLVGRPFGSTENVSVTATASWSEWPTLQSGGKRACLYAMSDGVLVAQTTYTVPAAPPTPVYVPPPAPVYVPPAPVLPVVVPSTQTLGYSEALGAARRWLKRTYGRRWSKGRGRELRCPVKTWSAQRGCYAVWRYKRKVYSKTVVVTETETSYLFHRSFASAPGPPVSVPSGSGDFCATHVCIPNFPNGTGSVVRCADGSYSQSGGRPGACSHHGGVARAASARRATNATPRRYVDTHLEVGAATAEAAVRAQLAPVGR